MKEYTLSMDPFQRPKVLDEKDATHTLIVRLILLEKGTYPTHPDMGVGIVSNYRFAFTEELEKLRTDILEQMSTYLPDIAATDVQVSEDEKEVVIDITVDDTLYELIFDKTTKTLKDLL